MTHRTLPVPPSLDKTDQLHLLYHQDGHRDAHTIDTDTIRPAGDHRGGDGRRPARRLQLRRLDPGRRRRRARPRPRRPSTLPGTTIPAGTTLRVGDQLDYLKTVLRLAGEDQDFPYEVEYSAFVGGPPMLQAFQGGAIDTGFVGSTPLIFAQAARPGHRGGRRLGARENGTYGLVTAPGVDDIDGWDDLAGQAGRLPAGHRRRGGAAPGPRRRPASTLADIDHRRPADHPGQPPRSRADRPTPASLVEPLTSVYLAANPDGAGGRRGRARSPTARRFLIASQPTPRRPGQGSRRSPTTSSRLVRAFAYLDDNPERDRRRRSTSTSTASTPSGPPRS